MGDSRSSLYNNELLARHAECYYSLPARECAELAQGGRMKGLATVLGIVMLGVAAGPAAGQAIRVEVGVHAAPISARVVFGPPIFTWYGYPARGAWRTNPYLARLYREHMIWLARERERFAHMRRNDWRYRQFVQRYDRDRIARERMLTREYQRWYRDRDRDWDRDRGWNRGRGRDDGWTRGRGRGRDDHAGRGGRH